jgi:hypothetical protein
MDVWVERELGGGEFPDQRLKARLGALLTAFGQRVGGTVPMACQDWAATKAAYRFFDNPRIDEGVILAGHFAATRARFAATAGPVLVLHDTSEFSFQRDAPDGIGTLSLIKGRHARHTVCGLLMHSSLVVTTAGVPLGLAAVKFWTRKKFKGTNALQRKVNPTRIPIEQKESVRWLDNLKQATAQLGEAIRRCCTIRPVERTPRNGHACRRVAPDFGGNLGATLPARVPRGYNASEAWRLANPRFSQQNRRKGGAGATLPNTLAGSFECCGRTWPLPNSQRLGLAWPRP